MLFVSAGMKAVEEKYSGETRKARQSHGSTFIKFSPFLLQFTADSAQPGKTRRGFCASEGLEALWCTPCLGRPSNERRHGLQLAEPLARALSRGPRVCAHPFQVAPGDRNAPDSLKHVENYGSRRGKAK